MLGTHVRRIPTHTAAGEELSKKQRQGVEKDFSKRKADYAKVRGFGVWGLGIKKVEQAQSLCQGARAREGESFAKVRVRERERARAKKRGKHFQNRGRRVGWAARR